ncbi:MAG: lysylphosphatidylglycerol synthase transmembrane domain-containing protein [Candidatus Hydrogenedentota bacterium]
MKKKLVALVGLLIGGFLIWILFRSTDWAQVWETVKNIDLMWLAIAHVPLMFSFVFRIIRWKYIVNSVTPTSIRNLASATQIGFFANFTLPGRVGEAVRALVLTRLTKIPFSKTFAYVALDRVTDLFALIAVMLVAIFAYQPVADVVIPASTFGTPKPIKFPAELYRSGAYSMGILMFAIIGSFVMLYVKKDFFIGIVERVIGVISKKLAAIGVKLLTHFAEGLEVFKSPRDMFLSIFFSMLTWAMPILIFYATLRAFNIDAPWYTPFVMQSILSVFIAAPGAPGFIGQYHVPIVITLVMILPDMNVDEAKAFALINHLIQLPPVLILGAYFLITDGFSITALASEGEQMQHEEAEHGAHDDGD